MTMPLVDHNGQPLTVEQVLDAQKEIARLNALVDRLQRQVRTDDLVNAYKTLCRHIHYAKRQKGKYTLDDYVHKIDHMYEIVVHHPDKEHTIP